MLVLTRKPGQAVEFHGRHEPLGKVIYEPKGECVARLIFDFPPWVSILRDDASPEPLVPRVLPTHGTALRKQLALDAILAWDGAHVGSLLTAIQSAFSLYGVDS